MPDWQGKSRGTPLGYRIFILICKKLGLRPAYFVLYFVAFYFFLFSYSSSGHIYRYFRKRHRRSVIASVRMIYKTYYVFGQTLLDKMVVMADLPNPFTFDFDGEEYLQTMVSEGRGGVLLSAHTGNWDAAGHLLKRLNTTVNVVLYDAEHKKIKNYMSEVTGKKNFNIIVVKNNLSHVFLIGEALRRNEIVCIHADRYLEGNKTISLELLGKKALFPAGPFLLAAAFGVPVSIVFSFKDSPFHYHFYGSKPIARKSDEGKEVYSAQLAALFVSELERKIRKYPHQWFNFYNFWKD
ncbi:MAG: lipid A biosynthesis acyltransferase [Crocinitomicaceae bacterium]|nr:lipid A biosynthesis acyltransferase [Crocinitomicaceae bacterium]